MNSDNTRAAADLAGTLDDFTEPTAAPDATRNIRLTVTGPHDTQQRTVQTPADIADRITAPLCADPARGTRRARAAGSDRPGSPAERRARTGPGRVARWPP
ncbi:hypothetical protein OG689_43240 [Kitasatospora sp. NBC_00240]|uniref:hypothetical protein n=1 Tax=Kitasatospora sp. NBC_00240 TaxID=2903567 RepID=UPI0022513F28|nr:hypothetical protein [Kitasatospora sp. NBC_00240]MCX5215957.1 hypothetical protein [Kitasatospora sp. NBC_00240]